jgi:serine/threonine-protein kinase PknG
VARCDRPDCGRGEIDEQGYCTECDRRPLASRASPDKKGAGGTGDTGGQTRKPQPAGEVARPEPWWGLTLVGRGTVPPPPPQDVPVSPGGTVPEEERFCVNNHPVGRGRPGRPARLAGFCGACQARYDFTSTAADRTPPVIANRYRVKRTLGDGGFGSALLAFDPNLGVDVVLKDLSRSQAVAATARKERDALAALRHDSIVRIYGFEAEHPRAEDPQRTEGPYLVLEYVRGTTLTARAEDPLEVTLGHGLQILQALDYLHTRGLLHIDVKPENIVRFAEQATDGLRDRVRLIDFGTVWPLGSAGPVDSYTTAYAPPEGDREHANPTESFDLFCLGVTLQTLCRYHLPQDDKPALRSLRLLLERATEVRVPARRFSSARQFAEQLSGVIRQVVAAPPTGRRVTRPSALFAPVTEPLHCGLGAPRPLGHWVAARPAPTGWFTMAEPFSWPQPADVVAALPAPLADPDDRELTPDRVTQLADCRAALRRGDLSAAEESLALAKLPTWSWARAWHAGLIAVASGDPDAASRKFGLVREALPGELVPLLALGLAAEMDGRLDEARDHYTAVAGTVGAVSAAGFGLARTYLRDGQRADAVRAAEQLAAELKAAESRYERQARIAAIRLRASAALGTSLPDKADLAEAARLVAALGADGATEIALSTEIEYGRFLLAADRRLSLSGQLRSLATLADTRPDFFALVDLANQLRPKVGRWPWRIRQTGDQLIRES